MNLGIKKAIDLLGTQVELAKALNVTQQAVTIWLNEKQKPSAKNAIAIEKATLGLVTRAEILPDIFGSV
jgi:DNA-binding transcriptional regulator YdaS (Cro superfamily)